MFDKVMFYTFYYNRVNNYDIKNNDNNEFEDDNKYECVLCFEEINNYNMYDYYEEHNRYIMNCNCMPHIHKECFELNYQKKKSCIICLTPIDKLINQYEYFVIYFNIRKMKYIFMITILFLVLYNLFIDIDQIKKIEELDLKKEYFYEVDLP